MYDYDALKKDISSLGDTAEVFSIGKSIMQKELYCIQIGTGSRVIAANGAHHGLEYLTSALLMKFAAEFLHCLNNDTPMFGYSPSELAKKTTLYIIPMVNPDGVDIAVNGLDITNPYHRRLISMVGIHSFNKVWQANAAGVDLNHNYDANHRITVSSPAPSLYGDEFPESQPETQAMTAFIRRVCPDVLLCFHSQGREIYYDFDGLAGERSRRLMSRLAEASGYSPALEGGTASYGGCKDWFIREFGGCGYTIEIGSGKNPLPLSMLNSVFEENARLILEAMLP